MICVTRLPFENKNVCSIYLTQGKLVRITKVSQGLPGSPVARTLERPLHRMQTQSQVGRTETPRAARHSRGCGTNVSYHHSSQRNLFSTKECHFQYQITLVPCVLSPEDKPAWAFLRLSSIMERIQSHPDHRKHSTPDSRKFKQK